MSSRRSWVGLVIVAAVVVAIIVAMRLGRAGGEAEERAPLPEVTVEIAKVERTTLHHTVAAYGTVMPEPGSEGAPPAQVLIGSSGSGVLVRIACVEGQRVAKGDLLFALDSRAAEVEAAKARRALAFAETTLARQQELLTTDATSKKALQEAEQQRDAARADLAAAETQLALLRITAPIAGTVVRIGAKLGQAVEPNTVLGEIVDLDRLVVSAPVPSRDARQVKVGQAVSLGDGSSGASRVAFVGADVDPRTDTVTIRAPLPAGAGLSPGTFLPVGIVTEEHAACLAVPVEALVTGEDGSTWIMRVEGDRAVRVPVTAGLRDGGLVEVAGPGVAEGSPIVTVGAYGLPDGAAVRIASGAP